MTAAAAPSKTAAPHASVLSVRNLSVHYGGVHAVRDVSLDVAVGESVGIIGPNGAGKSSLLRAIVGLAKPTGGSVVLDDTTLDQTRVETRVRRGIALAPEGRGLLTSLTVEENLGLGTYACGRLPTAEVETRMATVFDLFPVLSDRRAQRAGTLSGGEAAMLSVGRSLMANPRLLLLDEPTLGLAPMISAALFRNLGYLAEVGTTMLIVEQRAVGLFDVADRVLVMNRGEITAVVDPSAHDAASLQGLYFGEDGTPAPHTRRPSLES